MGLLKVWLKLIKIGLVISILNTCGYRNCVFQQGIMNVTVWTWPCCVLLSTQGIRQNGGSD